MARFGRLVRRVIFPTGFWRLTGDFSRLAGSHARVCVYARVKRVPVRRLRGGTELALGVFRFAGLSAGVSGRLPGGLAFPVSVAPACRWLPLCVLTGKCGNFGFLFGIKFLFLWLCFRIQTGIFFLETTGTCTSGSLSSTFRLSGVRAKRQGGEAGGRKDAGARLP